MRYTSGWKEGQHPRAAQTRLRVLGFIVGLTVLGCEVHTANDPKVIPSIGAQPAAIIVTSDGFAEPCFANSRACGGFYPVIGAVANEYLTQSSLDIGAWTKTWVPTGTALYLSAAGNGKVIRGSGNNRTEEPFQLACSNFSSECGDGYSTYHTCGTQRNEVNGTTSHAAQGGNPALTWFGKFSDARVCDAPPGQEQGCDENGNYVDEGGDPANCEDDDGGGGDGIGSGIQFEPGDYTNGETVDWATGIGNGGASVCGNAALVD